MPTNDTRAVFVFERPRDGEWFFVLIEEPNIFWGTANWLVEGYFNENKSEAHGPFDSRSEALETATALLDT